MLQRSLHELAVGSLLGGPRLTEFLAQHMRAPLGPIETWLGNGDLSRACQQALVSDLDDRWPRDFRLNELESIAELICPSSFLFGPEIFSLDALFNELMEIDGELICFRPAHVQAYIRLSAEIEPAMLVAWHLAGRCVAPAMPHPRQFERLVSIQTSFFSPRSFSHTPVAENHAHLGGIFGDGPVLGRLILELGEQDLSAALASWSLPEDRDVLPRLQRTRGIVQTLFRMWRFSRDDLQTSEISHQLQQALEFDSFTKLQNSQLNWKNLADGLDVGREVNSCWILFQIAQAISSFDLQRAWLFFLIGLWHTYRSPLSSLHERAIVLCVIGELTILRRRLVMNGRGLKRFTERYYNPSLRKLARRNSSSVDRDIARRIFFGPADMAELKVGLDGFHPSVISSLAKAIDGHETDPMRGLLPLAKNNTEINFRTARKATFDRLHLCVHFSRSGKNGIMQKRATLWKEADSLANTASATSLWSSAALLGGDEARNYQFEPANFLRALDVAGDETHWPIEIFAPILRWLRNIELGQNGTNSAIPRPHFSIHAGEDYAHPLSGMRHIDETVRFCGMTRGDRLGHALAIGIPPAQWFARHGEVLIDVDEHLDNLVWAWHNATNLAAKLPLAAQALPRLERRISRFIQHASWAQLQYDGLLSSQPFSLQPNSHPTPAELYDAWLLRRNCPQVLLREDPRMPLVDQKLSVGAPDYKRLFAKLLNLGTDSDRAASLFLARARQEKTNVKRKSFKVLLRASPMERQYQNSLEQLSVSSPLLYDHEESEEIDFMEALQDFLLDEYERIGLVLEANPTSNVYIGILNEYREHPIFRWDPPNIFDLEPGNSSNRFGIRRGPIVTTINTDDQGIMPTTMRTELHLMRQAAVDRGTSGSLADKWIEKIRLEGVQQFNRNHRTVFGSL